VEGCGDWISDVYAFDPARGLGSVDTAFDGGSESFGPGSGIRESVAACVLFRDFSVPDVM
jgi:hypothetical protein